MKRTQIQFPDPLYERLRRVADMNDWPLAEVVRRAAEAYLARFPEVADRSASWTFPTIDGGGDFLVDPARLRAEADAVAERAR